MFVSDPSLTTFEIETNIIIQQDVPFTISLTTTLSNVATMTSGNDILRARNDNDDNFLLQSFVSNDTIDMRQSSSVIGLREVLLAGASVNVSVNLTHTVTSSYCQQTTLLCIQLLIPSSANYMDVNTTNNLICGRLPNSQKICSQGITFKSIYFITFTLILSVRIVIYLCLTTFIQTSFIYSKK